MFTLWYLKSTSLPKLINFLQNSPSFLAPRTSWVILYGAANFAHPNFAILTKRLSPQKKFSPPSFRSSKNNSSLLYDFSVRRIIFEKIVFFIKTGQKCQIFWWKSRKVLVWQCSHGQMLCSVDLTPCCIVFALKPRKN